MILSVILALCESICLFSGGLILGMNGKANRLQHWSEMIKTPGQVRSRTHYLSANYVD